MACQRAALHQADECPRDPGDAVPRYPQEVDHGASTTPGGGCVGAHPHPLGDADIDGQQGVEGDSLEGGVELHAVLFGQLLRLPPLLGVAALGTSSSGLAALLSAGAPVLLVPLQGLIQGEELSPVEDVVPVSCPGPWLGCWHCSLSLTQPALQTPERREIPLLPAGSFPHSHPHKP